MTVPVGDGLREDSMRSELSECCVTPDVSIRDAVAQMDRNRNGIVLVVDGKERLVGTITDGDARRALLASVDMTLPITALLDRKQGSSYAIPITAPASADRGTLLSILQQHRILHVPLVDDEGRVVGLVTRDEFLPDRITRLQAVIMAGGLGKRMRPLTEDTPKPMLPVAGRPIMERMIERLRDAGVQRVSITTHHQSDKITAHFGDGKGFGVEIDYISEDRPLGTAGSLAQLDRTDDTMLVVNGDVLTDVDFGAMLDFHHEHRADLTVAVCRYDVEVPYGVVECDGPIVRALAEKPVMNLFVNAGIYLLEPAACTLVRSGERLDMTELIERLLGEGRRIVGFPIREDWIDVGHPGNYELAHEQVRQWSARP